MSNRSQGNHGQNRGTTQSTPHHATSLPEGLQMALWGHSSYALILEYYEQTNQQQNDIILTCCSKLDTFYTSSRYPSISGITPHELFNRGLANEAMKCAETVIKYVNDKISTKD